MFFILNAKPSVLLNKINEYTQCNFGNSQLTCPPTRKIVVKLDWKVNTKCQIAVCAKPCYTGWSKGLCATDVCNTESLYCPYCCVISMFVRCTVKHNTSNIDKNTLHQRHVSAHIVAIFRPYANILANTDHCTWGWHISALTSTYYIIPTITEIRRASYLMVS
jgi:hypothetical protein